MDESQIEWESPLWVGSGLSGLYHLNVCFRPEAVIGSKAESGMNYVPFRHSRLNARTALGSRHLNNQINRAMT